MNTKSIYTSVRWITPIGSDLKFDVFNQRDLTDLSKAKTFESFVEFIFKTYLRFESLQSWTIFSIVEVSTKNDSFFVMLVFQRLERRRWGWTRTDLHTHVNSEIIRSTVDVSNDGNTLREMFENEFSRNDWHSQSNDYAAMIAFEGKTLARHASRLECRDEERLRMDRGLTLMRISGCLDMCTMGMPRNFTTFCRGSSVYSVQRVSTIFAPEQGDE